MDYKRNGSTIILRLERGEEILQEIVDLAEKEGISAAKVSGIGAVDDFTIGFFDLSTKQFSQKRFESPHEVTSLLGNLTRKDGKSHAHLHITCGDKEGNIVGGHLISAKISLTAEIFINIIDATVNRKFDESVGIFTMSF